MNTLLVIEARIVSVLCPQRHVILSVPVTEWAGSALEASYQRLTCAHERINANA